MRITELLTALAAAGCRLIPDGAALRVQNPEHRLTDALRQQIRQHKPALLAALQEAGGPWWTCSHESGHIWEEISPHPSCTYK